MTAQNAPRQDMHVAIGNLHTVALTKPGTLYELLYCPNEQYLLVLDEAGLAELEAFDQKLDGAVAQLEAARTEQGSDNQKMLDAQQAVRNALREAARGDGSAGTDALAPLVQGKVSFNEMMRIGAAKYSLVPAEFIAKYKQKPSHMFKLPGNIIDTVKEVSKAEEIKDSQRAWRYTAADEAADPKHKAGTLNGDKVKKTFGQVKARIVREWKLAESTTTGQIPSELLIKKIAPKISAFLTADDFELIDGWIEKLNQDANVSYKRYETYRKRALEKLDKTTSSTEQDPARYFLPEDWDYVRRMVADIWGEQSDIYLDMKDVSYSKVIDANARTHYKDTIERNPLPPTCWDASAGAQVMRYTMGATVKAKFDLLKSGKLTLGADAAFDAALAEAKAEGRFMYPNSNGHRFNAKINVREEKTGYKIHGPGTLDQSLQLKGLGHLSKSPCFAVDSSLLTPAGADNLFACFKHWDLFKQTVNRSNNDASKRELFVQVVGHASSTGSDEYNLQLGARRAAVVADFIAEKQESWLGHFKSGHWGQDEVDFMAYVILIHYQNIKVPIDWDQIGSINAKVSLVEQIKLQVPDLVLRRAGMLPALQNIMFLKKSQWHEIHPSTPNRKPVTKLQRLIEQYTEVLRVYASDRNGTKITYAHHLLSQVRLFHDPFISTGEQGNIVDGEVFKNRRCDFIPWEIDPANSPMVEKEVDVCFGDIRATFEGSISAWAGANINLGADLALATPKGMLAAVGAVRDVKNSGKVSDKTIVQAKSGLEASANAGAFAGAKAELGLKAMLEWRSPQQGASFGALGTAGYTVTGMVGIGGKVEFKVGFDRDSSRFVVKMHAEACLGPGCGGELNITVGVAQCWNFIILVHGELKRHNFNYLDIFEKEDDESGLDVFELYSAWAWKMLKMGNVIGGASALVLGKSLEMLVESLRYYQDLMREWKEGDIVEEQTNTLIDTIHEMPEIIKYLTPESKGRVLYDLITVDVGFGEYVGNLMDFDVNKKREEAALILIKEGIVSKRDWYETLEHIGEVRDGELVPQIIPKADPISKVNRVMQNNNFLKSRLLNDEEDWASVMQHVDGLPG